MKLKIGDIVQTTASAYPPRRVGKIIEVGDVGWSLPYPYNVEFLNKDIDWYLESELRPYKKKSERKKVECDCRCHGRRPFASYKDLCFHCKPATREEDVAENRTPEHTCTCEWRHLRKVQDVTGDIDIFYCIFNPEHRREV